MKTGSTVGFMTVVTFDDGDWVPLYDRKDEVIIGTRREARQLKNLMENKYPNTTYRIARVVLDK